MRWLVNWHKRVQVSKYSAIEKKAAVCCASVYFATKFISAS